MAFRLIYTSLENNQPYSITSFEVLFIASPFEFFIQNKSIMKPVTVNGILLRNVHNYDIISMRWFDEANAYGSSSICSKYCPSWLQ